MSSKLEEILSICDKFESKVAIDVPTGIDSNTEKYLKHVLVQIKQLPLFLISLDELMKVKIIVAS